MDQVGTRRWRALRAGWGRRIADSLVYCFRCGERIVPGEPWDLDHVTARVDGGTFGDALPSHRSCNRRHGAEIARARVRRGKVAAYRAAVRRSMGG